MRKPSLEDLLPVIEGDSLFNEEMLKAALEDHKRDVARLGGKVVHAHFSCDPFQSTRFNWGVRTPGIAL